MHTEYLKWGLSHDYLWFHTIETLPFRPNLSVYLILTFDWHSHGDIVWHRTFVFQLSIVMEFLQPKSLNATSDWMKEVKWLTYFCSLTHFIALPLIHISFTLFDIKRPNLLTSSLHWRKSTFNFFLIRKIWPIDFIWSIKLIDRYVRSTLLLVSMPDEKRKKIKRSHAYVFCSEDVTVKWLGNEHNFCGMATNLTYGLIKLLNTQKV